MGKFYRNRDLENKIISGSIFRESKEFWKFKKAPTLVSFVNPYSYSIIRNDKKTVDNIDIWFCDGGLLSRILTFSFGKKIERASFDFSSVATEIFGFCEENNLKISLVGGTSVEIDEAHKFLAEIYPKLDFVLVASGYCNNNSEYQSIIESIEKSGAQVVIAGLGTPRQEHFLIECSKRLTNMKYGFTCGGFLSQTSTRGDYYSPWIKKTGLRWLQRAWSDKHVRKRLLIDYPVFLFRFVLDR